MLRAGQKVKRVLSKMAKPTAGIPLVVIVGATGTGKSKLAVDLATKYNGEIINADAIQMYRGLPIVTNKMPQNERNGVPHHLLDQIRLEEPTWTVHEFVNESDRLVKDIRDRGKLPIVVGGTNYYVYSLLFENAIVAQSDSEPENVADTTKMQAAKDVSSIDLTILNAPNEEIYAKLQEFDPISAQSWHPNDRRKIQRSLEMWLKTGRKASDVYAEQKVAKESIFPDEPRSGLRYDPLIFWLDAENAALKRRLDARVDVMIDHGLLDEVRTMRRVEREAKSQGIEIDQTRGVWVAIGYKELVPWLDQLERTRTDCEEDECKDLARLQQSGIEAIKSGTRQYAKRQNRWIRIRLAKALQDASAFNRLFLLDCTDLGHWHELIARPSEDILGTYLLNEELPPNTSLSPLAASTFEQMLKVEKLPNRQTHFCDTCEKTLMNEEEWKKHLKSSGHKKVLDGIRKRTSRDQYLSSAGVSATG